MRNLSLLLPLTIASVVFGEVDIAKDFDFSRCGYEQNRSTIPLVPADFKVDPIEGDATALIQQAIDVVSSRPLNQDGFRGAVLLGHGTFNISGTLTIAASGVVLRVNPHLGGCAAKKQIPISARPSGSPFQRTKNERHDIRCTSIYTL